MILPDVNVLVYAVRREAEHHERYATWLARMVAGEEELALHDIVLAEVARLVTNPRIFADPAPMPVTLKFLARYGRRDGPAGCRFARFPNIRTFDPAT